jgi:glycine/D-amino acid oxidase-like deaminating enzyme
MQKTEILIIGGGIAGVSIAYHLTHYGYAVTLLERSEIASEEEYTFAREEMLALTSRGYQVELLTAEKETR